jgi:DNA-binding NarL/FixJ family response regulator
MSIKVLLADDHALVRHAVADLLAVTDDIDVVAECSDGDQVTAAAEQSQPDVVLMDVQMPTMTGLDATRGLRATHPRVRVIVLSGLITAASAREAEALGVAGYLLKGDDPGALPDHIRRVASGGTAWSLPAAAAIGGSDAAYRDHFPPPPPAVAALGRDESTVGHHQRQVAG